MLIRNGIEDLPQNIRKLVTINPEINKELVARYNQKLDLIELNPEQLEEALQNPTLAEEFWHRRQEKILRTKGWGDNILQTDKTVDKVCEAGIIPRMRDIASKEGYGWAPYEFFRYAQYAMPLSQTFLDHINNPNATVEKLLADTAKEPLFDGIGWVIKTVNAEKGNAPDFIRELALSDSKGLRVENDIKLARADWVEGNIILNK